MSASSNFIPPNLIAGYKAFREKYESTDYADYRRSAPVRQAPDTMVIACADSRCNPAIILGAKPGELFVIHNVANLVPLYAGAATEDKSVGAAVEFAVKHLQVKHIIIFGHSNCGGIRALVTGPAPTQPDSYSFIDPWVAIAKGAKENTLHQCADNEDSAKCAYCERASLVASRGNLQTFPWVAQALAQGTLQIHTWYFDIGSGIIDSYQPDGDTFLPLLDSDRTA